METNIDPAPAAPLNDVIQLSLRRYATDMKFQSYFVPVSKVPSRIKVHFYTQCEIRIEYILCHRSKKHLTRVVANKSLSVNASTFTIDDKLYFTVVKRSSILNKVQNMLEYFVVTVFLY